MAKVKMTFNFDGSKEEAINYLKTQLPAWGAHAVTDFISGDEEWEVDGEQIEIVEFDAEDSTR